MNRTSFIRGNRSGQHNTEPKNSCVPEGLVILLHMWHPSCYACYKPGDKSQMKKRPDCDYEKRNISVIICDTDTP